MSFDVDRDRGSELLAAARAGDRSAFTTLTGPVRPMLLRHCYRMLGSAADADDAVQEALLRAWRALGSYEARRPLTTWLYRIATNVCLTAAARRSRTVPLDPASAVLQVEPLADRWPEHLESADPAHAVVREENVSLAFVAALQVLAPRQRAVLLLRDVLAWPARDVAELLDTSVPAVNSALQRGRTALQRELDAGRLSRDHDRVPTEDERRLVQRLIDAWHRNDVDALAGLLAEDVTLTMPPEVLRVEGRESVASFLADIAARGRLDRFRLVPVRANDQPAAALYLEETGEWRGHGVLVLAVRAGLITSMVRFGQPGLVTAFGLPEVLEPGELLRRS